MSEFDGPIPGENFTSDVKNYPWHRPPQFTNPDDALDFVAARLLSEEGSQGPLSMLELGAPVSSVVVLIVLKGMMKGYWSLDLGILLAGPISHILCLMAKAYGIKYDLGIARKRKGIASELVKAFQPEKAAKAQSAVVENLQTIKQDMKFGGLMGGAKTGEV